MDLKRVMGFMNKLSDRVSGKNQILIISNPQKYYQMNENFTICNITFCTTVYNDYFCFFLLL